MCVREIEAWRKRCQLPISSDRTKIGHALFAHKTLSFVTNLQTHRHDFLGKYLPCNAISPPQIPHHKHSKHPSLGSSLGTCNGHRELQLLHYSMAARGSSIFVIGTKRGCRCVGVKWLQMPKFLIKNRKVPHAKK